MSKTQKIAVGNKKHSLNFVHPIFDWSQSPITNSKATFPKFTVAKDFLHLTSYKNLVKKEKTKDNRVNIYVDDKLYGKFTYKLGKDGMVTFDSTPPSIVSMDIKNIKRINGSIICNLKDTLYKVDMSIDKPVAILASGFFLGEFNVQNCIGGFNFFTVTKAYKERFESFISENEFTNMGTSSFYKQEKYSDPAAFFSRYFPDKIDLTFNLKTGGAERVVLKIAHIAVSGNRTRLRFKEEEFTEALKFFSHNRNKYKGVKATVEFDQFYHLEYDHWKVNRKEKTVTILKAESTKKEAVPSSNNSNIKFAEHRKKNVKVQTISSYKLELEENKKKSRKKKNKTKVEVKQNYPIYYGEYIEIF